MRIPLTWKRGEGAKAEEIGGETEGDSNVPTTNRNNTWTESQMSWYENLLQRWSQIHCPRAPINSFHFVHFPSNCALCVPLCVLSLSLSLSIHPLLKKTLRLSSLQTRFSFSSRFIGSTTSSLCVSCIWVALQQTWCTQCRTLSPCSAQLMGSGKLASMPMRSCPHWCPTTLQRVFFCKDMASLVAFASLRWDLVWHTSTDCTDTTSHQSCALADCNFGLP